MKILCSKISFYKQRFELKLCHEHEFRLKYYSRLLYMRWVRCRGTNFLDFIKKKFYSNENYNRRIQKKKQNFKYKRIWNLKKSEPNIHILAFRMQICSRKWLYWDFCTERQLTPIKHDFERLLNCAALNKILWKNMSVSLCAEQWKV